MALLQHSCTGEGLKAGVTMTLFRICSCTWSNQFLDIESVVLRKIVFHDNFGFAGSEKWSVVSFGDPGMIECLECSLKPVH